MLNTVVTDEASIYVVRGAFNYYISMLGGGSPEKLTFDYLSNNYLQLHNRYRFVGIFLTQSASVSV